MTVAITKKRDEPLLDKIKIEALWTGEKNAVKSDVAKDLAKQLSTSEELVAVEHMYPRFGERGVHIVASAYARPETKKFFKKKEKKAPAAPSGG